MCGRAKGYINVFEVLIKIGMHEPLTIKSTK